MLSEKDEKEVFAEIELFVIQEPLTPPSWCWSIFVSWKVLESINCNEEILHVPISQVNTKCLPPEFVEEPWLRGNLNMNLFLKYLTLGMVAGNVNDQIVDSSFIGLGIIDLNLPIVIWLNGVRIVAELSSVPLNWKI